MRDGTEAGGLEAAGGFKAEGSALAVAVSATGGQPERVVSGILPESALTFRPRRRTDQIEWQGLTPVAAWLIALCRPRVFVELGSHRGDSYCAFCQSIVEQQIECRAFAIDTWEGDGHTGPHPEWVFDDLRDYHDPAYGRFSRLLRMTFDEGLKTFADQSVDLLHIDGLHTYEAVLHDFKTWLPKVSPAGVIIMHDSAVRERGFGVYKLWEQLRERYLGFEIGFSNGLAVVIPDPDHAPRPMVEFARLTEAQRRPVLAVLHALGDTVVQQAKTQWHKQEAEKTRGLYRELFEAVAQRGA